jgi:hypothetical protein
MAGQDLEVVSDQDRIGETEEPEMRTNRPCDDRERNVRIGALHDQPTLVIRSLKTYGPPRLQGGFVGIGR